MADILILIGRKSTGVKLIIMVASRHLYTSYCFVAPVSDKSKFKLLPFIILDTDEK